MSYRYADADRGSEGMSGDEWKNQLGDWKNMTRSIKFEDDDDHSDDDRFHVRREPSPPSNVHHHAHFDDPSPVKNTRKVRPASATRDRKAGTRTSASHSSTTSTRKRPASATRTRPKTAGARPSSASGSRARKTPYTGGKHPVGSRGTTLAGLSAVRGRDPFLPTDPESFERAGMDSNLTLEDVYLDELGLAAAAMKERQRRKGPATSLEPEEMYERMQELKKKLRAMEDEKKSLKAKLTRAERDSVKKDKMLESLVQGHDFVGNRFDNYRSETNTINSLRKRVKSLESDISERETQINKLKSDRKATRVAELELELKTYYNETRRLQKLLGPLMAQQQSGIKPSRKSKHAFSGGNIGASEGELIALQEEALHVKTKNKNLKAENAALERKVMRYTQENEQLCQRLLSIDTQLQGMPQSERMTLEDAQSEIQKLKRELKQKAQMIELMESDNHSKRKELEQERGPLETKLAKKREKIAKLKEENANINRLYVVEQGNSARLRSELMQAEEQADKARADCAKAIERLRRLEANAAAAEDELQGMSDQRKEDVRALEKQLRNEQKRNSKVNAELDKAKSTIADLEKKLRESEKQQSSQPRDSTSKKKYTFDDDDSKDGADIYQKEQQAATKIQARYRGHAVRRRHAQERVQRGSGKTSSSRPGRHERGDSEQLTLSDDDDDDDTTAADSKSKKRKANTRPGMDEAQAATKIQARYRGHAHRRQARLRREEQQKKEARAATRLQALERGRQARKYAKKKKAELEEIRRNEADTYHYGQVNDPNELEEMLTLSEEEERAEAASKIQAIHRGRKIRRMNTLENLRLERMKSQGSIDAGENSESSRNEKAQAATKIQAVYRGRRARKQHRATSSSKRAGAGNTASRTDQQSAPSQREHEAATRIQARYRGHRTRKQGPPTRTASTGSASAPAPQHGRRARPASAHPSRRGVSDGERPSSPLARSPTTRKDRIKAKAAARREQMARDDDDDLGIDQDDDSSEGDDIEPYDGGDAEEELSDDAF